MSVVTHECLSDALSAAQGEFPRILKDKIAVTPKYSYAFADISDVIAAVAPVLSRHGLCQLQRFAIREGQQLLVTELRHKAECISSEMILPLAGLDPQGIGKVLTYYRRYALQALLGVAAERDDDAADTGGVRQPEAARRAPEPAPDTHDLLVHAHNLLDATYAVASGDELLDVVRQVRGDFAGSPFWPRLVRANRTLALELQQEIKSRAPAFDLDLSAV